MAPGPLFVRGDPCKMHFSCIFPRVSFGGFAAPRPGGPPGPLVWPTGPGLEAPEALGPAPGEPPGRPRGLLGFWALRSGPRGAPGPALEAQKTWIFAKIRSFLASGSSQSLKREAFSRKTVFFSEKTGFFRKKPVFLQKTAIYTSFWLKQGPRDPVFGQKPSKSPVPRSVPGRGYPPPETPLRVGTLRGILDVFIVFGVQGTCAKARNRRYEPGPRDPFSRGAPFGTPRNRVFSGTKTGRF